MIAAATRRKAIWIFYLFLFMYFMNIFLIFLNSNCLPFKPCLLARTLLQWASALEPEKYLGRTTYLHSCAQYAGNRQAVSLYCLALGGSGNLWPTAGPTFGLPSGEMPQV